MPDDTDNKCPTCDREAGHSAAVRVKEIAQQLRADNLDAYTIVDLIKYQWKHQ